MAFSSVSSTLQIGVIGQLSNRDDNNLVQLSKPLVDATALTPGRLIYKDLTNDGVKIIPNPIVQGLIAGVCVDDGSLPLDVTTYVTGKVVPFLRRGRMWVLTYEAVKYGDPVYCTQLVNVNPLGSFGMSDSDAGTAQNITSFGFAWTGANTSGKAELELNLP